MSVDVYETRREFNQRFHDGIYICSWCKSFTADPNICIRCGNQANQLLTANTYKYIIKEESEEVNQIFRPIELEGG